MVDARRDRRSGPRAPSPVLGWGRIEHRLLRRRTSARSTSDRRRRRCTTAYGAAFKPADAVRRRSARHVDPTARDFCEGDRAARSSSPTAAPARWPASSPAPRCVRRPRDPASTPARPTARSTAGSTAHAGGRLRPQPPAARRRAGDADLDLAPPRGRRLLHDLQVGPRQRRRLRRRHRPLDLRRLPLRGQGIAGLEASKPSGDRASIYYRVDVEPAPGAHDHHPRLPTVTPPAKTGPLATILAAKRPKVKRGHFRHPHPLRQDGPEGAPPWSRSTVASAGSGSPARRSSAARPSACA